MPKVLLIDDDPQLRALITTVLTKNSIEVSNAQDGASGLARARVIRPDLIILDIIMPGMDGFQVARRLREDPACAQIPIMILTAYGSPYGRKSATEAGVDAYLTKPFDIDDLVAKVKIMITDLDKSPNAKTAPLETLRQDRFIAVHSLRGGLGCTSLAITLAQALNELWHEPALLLDADFSAGHMATALNWHHALSWSDLRQAVAGNAYGQELDNLSIAYRPELHLVAAPGDPTTADQFSPLVVGHILGLLRTNYEYIVADLAHDLRDSTCQLLKQSQVVFSLLSPDPVSVHMAMKALDAYATLAIQPHKLKLIVVETRPAGPVKQAVIEEIVGRPVAACIPYTPEINDAYERRLPFAEAYPAHPITRLTRDLARAISKPEHRGRTQPGQADSEARPLPPPASQNGAHPSLGRALLRRLGLSD